MFIFAVMGAALIALFIVSLLEIAWISIHLKDIVTHENGHGPTRKTLAVRALLKERMMVVLFLLLGVELIVYYPALEISRLAEDGGGIIRITVYAYPFILFFVGEMAAKFIGYRLATEVALASAIPLHALLGSFFSITCLTKAVSRFTGGKDLRLTREEDVLATAQLAEEHGSLHPVESMGIKQWLDAGNQTVGDFVIPLEGCTKVTSTRPTRRELRNAAKRHSEIIVCPEEETVTGIIMSEDIIELLNGDADEIVGIAKRVQPVPDLPATTPIPEAIRLLRKRPIGVVTEHGRPVGIFVVNDIFDRIIESESE